MFVAMVTAPVRPAWATIPDSFSWNFAFSVSCLMPRRLSISARISDFSIEVVPTRVGCLRARASSMVTMIALYFSRAVR